MTVSFRAEMQGMLRERLLDAAHEMIETSGWSSVTMAKLASAVGVSRQTVHTEVGTRHGLAEALTLRELGRFLDLVRARMGAETDIVAGIRSACHGVLELGEASVLVRTVFGSVTNENDADFLTILTTESGEIVEARGVPWSPSASASCTRRCRSPTTSSTSRPRPSCGWCCRH